MFGAAQKMHGSGVTQYRMFEVFENEPEAAPQADRRLEFQTFSGTPSELKRTIDPPARNGAKHLYGWVFKTYFADMPVYLPFLWSLFRERGGSVQQAMITPEFVSQLSDDQPVINCLGYGARSLFHDDSPAIFMRGRQLLVPGAPPLVGADK